MIDQSDFEQLLKDRGMKPEEVWFQEVTFRYLVPRGTSAKDVEDRALDRDWRGTPPIGSPKVCETCQTIGISTEGFPWGAGKLNRAFYCPKCDGGEHI